MYLAQKIAQNKQYSISGRADDEYDFDDGPRRKTRKKGAKDNKLTEKTNFPQRILTQQERCQFCFENPSRPRHLVVAIANFTYLSLPHWQSIVPGHCCILTSQVSISLLTQYIMSSLFMLLKQLAIALKLWMIINSSLRSQDICLVIIYSSFYSC